MTTKPIQQIQEIKQTCKSCPSQWEIKLKDGRMIYVRYRWGYLSISVSENPTDDINDAIRGEEIVSAQFGGMYGGTLDEPELMPYLELAINRLRDDEE